ncbi:20432_t:CDS:2 [Gigaspora margarita]|uniref:20432_t:CDS:1 n=1 Tax=Gigaspora margarita TaxID=4874 RepID=A0ABN7UY96_GIGMA|nr:20432_t:CDS:2 [Gigaspora margarita]
MDKWATKPICIKYITSRNNKQQEKKGVKHWRTVSEVTKIETRIEKCSGCEHNRSTVEENCTICIKFDEGWKVIPKNAISKIESSIQRQIKLNLASLAQDTYHRDPLENEQGFKELRSLESSEKELILQSYGSSSSTGKQGRRGISRRSFSSYYRMAINYESRMACDLDSNSYISKQNSGGSAISITNIESSKHIATAKQ